MTISASILSISRFLIAFGLAAPIATSLIGGGPVTMIWGYAIAIQRLDIILMDFWSLLFVATLTLSLALSLAEICSLYPTSAGAYYWTYKLAPNSSRVLLSWIVGWMTIVGVWTISLSVNFGLSYTWPHISESRRLTCRKQGLANCLLQGCKSSIPNGLRLHGRLVRLCYVPPNSSLNGLTSKDLIFLAVLAVSSLICLFFNKYLPLIDVSADFLEMRFLALNLLTDTLRLLDRHWDYWFAWLSCSTIIQG
jgi:amino acid transporter